MPAELMTSYEGVTWKMSLRMNEGCVGFGFSLPSRILPNWPNSALGHSSDSSRRQGMCVPADIAWI